LPTPVGVWILDPGKIAVDGVITGVEVLGVIAVVAVETIAGEVAVERIGAEVEEVGEKVEGVVKSAVVVRGGADDSVEIGIEFEEELVR